MQQRRSGGGYDTWAAAGCATSRRAHSGQAHAKDIGKAAGQGAGASGDE
jgi:hypothetical protein